MNGESRDYENQIPDSAFLFRARRMRAQQWLEQRTVRRVPAEGDTAVAGPGSANRGHETRCANPTGAGASSVKQKKYRTSIGTPRMVVRCKSANDLRPGFLQTRR